MARLLTCIFLGAVVPNLVTAEEDLECLARNIYFEARGESLDGQLAVALVTLNRVEDDRWPNNICDVVYQRSQFSWTIHNPTIREQDSWEIAQEMAEEALEMHEEGMDITDGAVYFSRTSSNYFHAPLITRIGNHAFFG